MDVHVLTGHHSPISSFDAVPNLSDIHEQRRARQDSDQTVDEPINKKPKKSQRQTLSCTECSRRKTKCDKVVPCSQCTKRGKGHLCKQEHSIVVKKESATRAKECDRDPAELNAIMTQTCNSRQTSVNPPRDSGSDKVFRELTDVKALADGLNSRIADLEHLLRQALQSQDQHANSTSSIGSSTALPSIHQFYPFESTTDDALSASRAIPSAAAEGGYESLLSTSTRPPSLASGDNESDERQAEQELEASVALEFLALGRHRNFDTNQNASADLHDNQSPPSNGFQGNVTRHYQPTMPLLLYPTLESLADTLPSRSTTDPIVFHSIDSLGWHHGALHSPTFKLELEKFWATGNDESNNDKRMTTRFEKSDPAWLAMLFSVLVVGVANLPPGAAQLFGYTEEDQNMLSKKWFDCAMACLYRANFMQTHSMYALQAISVLVVSGQDAAGPNLIPTLLTAAISSAQELGLHRMPSDQEWDLATRDEPLSHRIQSLITREMSKRVFWTLCTQDWFGTAYRKTYIVQPTQVTTPLPLNMHDQDLLRGDMINRPIHAEYTVVSKLLLWIQIARCLQSTFEHLDQRGGNPSYEFLLQVDERLDSILKHAPIWLHPNGPTDGMPPCVDWVRSTFVISSNHKVLTLHRPFLHQAFQDPRYQSSRQRAITASRTILREALRCGDKLFRLWTIPYHISAACCVVLLHLFQLCRASKSALIMLEAGVDDVVERANDMRTEVEGALKVLQTMQETSAVARRGTALVSNLLEQEQMMRANRRQGTEADDRGRSRKRRVPLQHETTEEYSPTVKLPTALFQQQSAETGQHQSVTTPTPSHTSCSPRTQGGGLISGAPEYSPMGLEFPQEFLDTFANSGSDWGLGFPQIDIHVPQAFSINDATWS
ncbi:hypothetical protein OIO90_002846 [Microbotryomycetes sp. JL221]|nr:hypothetical protein OIO90_002846 [Microbotryomycetes sp. JL221]